MTRRFFMQTASLIVVAGLMSWAACDKKKSEKEGEKAAEEKYEVRKDVTGEELHEAYDKTLGNMERTDGYPERAKDVKKMVGAPHVTEDDGNTLIWRAKDKDGDCRELTIWLPNKGGKIASGQDRCD